MTTLNPRKVCLTTASCWLLLSAAFLITARAQTPNTPTERAAWGKEVVDKFKMRHDRHVTIIGWDGTKTFGVLGATTEESFTFVKSKNETVTIRYEQVRGMAAGRLVPTKAQKTGRWVESELTLPLRIIQCLLASCGS